MTVAQDFWEDSRVIAEECLVHPFVRGIADGSLDPAKYRDFIAQDAYFLEAFARGYAHCLARSPDRDGLDAFHRLLDGVSRELELHHGVAERLGIDLARVEPAPPTLAYTRFLAEAITAGATPGEMLAAMTPCMRLYAYLGAEITRVSASLPNPYHEWIETYSSGQFQQLAALVESLLDRYASGSLAEREHYQRAMGLERRFFDAAWQGWRADADPDPVPLSTEALIERHRDAWLEATAASVFVGEIREGTLDETAWRRWLAQDSICQDAGARGDREPRPPRPALPAIPAARRDDRSNASQRDAQESAQFSSSAGAWRATATGLALSGSRRTSYASVARPVDALMRERSRQDSREREIDRRHVGGGGAEQVVSARARYRGYESLALRGERRSLLRQPPSRYLAGLRGASDRP